MATPAYVNSASGKGVYGTSVAVTVPSGSSADDLMFVALFLTADQTPGATGFSQVGTTRATAAGGYVDYFYKTLTGGEGSSITFSWTSLDYPEWISISFSGCATTSQLDDFEFHDWVGDGSNNCMINDPGLTTTATNSLLMMSVTKATTFTASSWTSPLATAIEKQADTFLITAGYGVQAVAGDSGSKTLTTVSGNWGGGAADLIAFKASVPSGRNPVPMGFVVE